MMISKTYNPDVLSCLANLSNDEVFTPPELVNKILDLLPKDIWKDRNITFLDPNVKTGVFLREIVKRLDNGLANKIPHKLKRIDHIFKKQIYGVSVSELTALLSRRSVYCSKKANGKYSICDTFNNEDGNIIYERLEHIWEKGKCKYCGGNEGVYARGEEFESYAYQFIHKENPEKLFNMRFDVIIGNPPYQLDTGGSGRQAKPIYHKFISQAKKLSPRYLIMVIPARWYAGGFGLDDFRHEMLNDKRIKHLVDFENASDIFPGVDIAGGVCYFLWERDYEGDCTVTSTYNGTRVSLNRSLNEFNIFVRQSKAIPIIRKIVEKNKPSNKYLNDVVSSIKPFGLPTNYKPISKGIPCRFIQKVGLGFADKRDVIDTKNLLNKWKLLIPKAPIAGQTDFSRPIRFYHNKNCLISKPGECCTESWIVACSFDTKKEVESFKSYLFTKIVRFLILQTTISQDVNRKNFCFVPDLGKYKEIFTDEMLIKKWSITKNEWEYINSRILKTKLDSDG